MRIGRVFAPASIVAAGWVIYVAATNGIPLRISLYFAAQNFLSDEGWGKREYDSIFTRETVEEQGIILPVWHGVSRRKAFSHSPVLANKVGVDWELGEDEVARKLVQTIEVQEGTNAAGRG